MIEVPMNAVLSAPLPPLPPMPPLPPQEHLYAESTEVEGEVLATRVMSKDVPDAQLPPTVPGLTYVAREAARLAAEAALMTRQVMAPRLPPAVPVAAKKLPDAASNNEDNEDNEVDAEQLGNISPPEADFPPYVHRAKRSEFCSRKSAVFGVNVLQLRSSIKGV